MNSVRPKSALKSRHAAMLWLLFMALFARGMLPSGTMLAFGGQSVSVVLCTPFGAQTQALDKSGSPLKSMHGETCPFGFALSMAAAPAVVAVELPQPAVYTFGLVSSALNTHARPFEHYSARAPPLV